MYHVPVLLDPCVDALIKNANGVYVDATFGGGGHSRRILERLGDAGRLLGFDQDVDARKNIPDDGRFTFIQSNFKYLKKYLRVENAIPVDGILADLGVSSFQLDEATRGFSYRFEAMLDMRMNQGRNQTAADVLNSYSNDELVQVLSTYGEVRNSKTLARAIVQTRTQTPFETNADLLGLIDKLYVGNKTKYAAQVYQAIRIEVNQEMQALEDFLTDALDVLMPGGRLVVMSYHSLEDRLVKRLMKAGNVQGQVQRSEKGAIERPFELITKKPVLPDKDEIAQNPRARSAKLRVAEKK